jgi:DNA-binding PadR family transcriptional regulator
MSVQHALLGFMESTPRHGYDLKRSYDSLFAEMRPLRYGQIYATLSRLERDGLVELVDTSPGQGPDRKTYAITGDGVTDLERWYQVPEPAQSPIDSELFLKVTLALLSGRDASRIIDSQRDRHAERMRDLTKAKVGAGDHERALLDYALFHLEADLRWMDHTAQRLGELRRALTS